MSRDSLLELIKCTFDLISLKDTLLLIHSRLSSFLSLGLRDAPPILKQGAHGGPCAPVA